MPSFIRLVTHTDTAAHKAPQLLQPKPRHRAPPLHGWRGSVTSQLPFHGDTSPQAIHQGSTKALPISLCSQGWMLLSKLPQDGENFGGQDMAALFTALRPLGTAVFCFNFVSSGCLLLSLNHHLTHAIYHNLSCREMMSYASHTQKQKYKIIYIFQRDQLSGCLV